MKYHFKIHKESNGYWAECLELDGCFTQADTLEDLNLNMQEALNLYIQEPAASRKLFPLANENIKITKNIVEVDLEPTLALSLLLKHARIEQGLTQEQAAKNLGFVNLYSYQRLEKKCNPSIRILSRIKKQFPNISIDLALN